MWVFSDEIPLLTSEIFFFCGVLKLHDVFECEFVYIYSLRIVFFFNFFLSYFSIITTRKFSAIFLSIIPLSLFFPFTHYFRPVVHLLILLPYILY